MIRHVRRKKGIIKNFGKSDFGHNAFRHRTGGGGSVQLGIHSDIVPKKKQKGKNATQKPSSEIDNTG